MADNNNDLSKILEILGGSGGGINPLIQGGMMGLSALGGLIDTPEKKHGRWQMGMSKDLGDLIRWKMLGRDVVNPGMLNTMQNRNYDALAPVRSNMSYAAARSGGVRSGQMQNMFAQNYFPIAAQTSNQNQQWATGMNVQNNQFLASLLARLTGA